MIRSSGDMIALPGAPKLNKDQLQQILFEIAPERNRKQWEETSDTDFAYALDGIGRFRCNYFRDRFGIGAVFRRIPDKILSAEQLGLPAGVMRLCDFKKGLVLVTGPTGSGKSTTLAAMIDHINATRAEHIITIEDPVEFVHPAKCTTTPRASPPPCAPCCAKTPTSCWSVKCAISRRRASPSRPPRPATWCSAPCTPRPRPARSTASSTSSPPTSRSRSA
jgi:hypothetical protein